MIELWIPGIILSLVVRVWRIGSAQIQAEYFGMLNLKSFTNLV
jgi:hypothetical protein